MLEQNPNDAAQHLKALQNVPSSLTSSHIIILILHDILAGTASSLLHKQAELALASEPCHLLVPLS